MKARAGVALSIAALQLCALVLVGYIRAEDPQTIDLSPVWDELGWWLAFWISVPVVWFAVFIWKLVPMVRLVTEQSAEERHLQGLALDVGGIITDLDSAYRSRDITKWSAAFENAKRWQRQDLRAGLALNANLEAKFKELVVTPQPYEASWDAAKTWIPSLRADKERLEYAIRQVFPKQESMKQP